jgi:rRNA maturation endonuclease Nob1
VSLFLLILAWMVFTAVIGVVVDTFLRRNYHPWNQFDHPRCGGCGYIVIGLPSHICPECGGNLRDVGVD